MKEIYECEGCLQNYESENDFAICEFCKTKDTCKKCDVRCFQCKKAVCSTCSFFISGKGDLCDECSCDQCPKCESYNTNHISTDRGANKNGEDFDLDNFECCDCKEQWSE